MTVASDDGSLRLQHKNAQVLVGPGVEVSVGRSGQVPLADSRRMVPAVAALIECDDRQWELAIPIDVKLWIEVSVGGQRCWSGTGGHRTSQVSPRSELVIRTTLSTYRVQVAWQGSAGHGPRASGTTQLAYRVLNPLAVNDRAWIVACAERLQAWNRPALSSTEIAAAMPASVTANAIDVRLQRSKDKLFDAVDLAGASTDGTRDGVVDWLVSSGAVDPAMLDEALRREGMST